MSAGRLASTRRGGRVGLVGIQEERGGAWARIVLDAPPGNLLSLEMVRALRRAVAAVRDRPTLKWMTLEGAGAHFCYGAAIQEHLPDSMATVLPETHALLRDLLACPASTAALVRGRCLGGGFELALACDDVIATPEASFALPEIALGAFPPAAAALLPLRVGASRAARAIVTGDPMPADYWHGAGLVSVAAAPSALHEAAAAWFDRHLAPRSAAALRHAVAASRLVLRALAEPALARAESLYLDGLLRTADAAEGVRAWMEKRAPQWRDA